MDLELERHALMQTSRDWARAAASGNVDLILSYWSDDAVVMPPGQPAVVGKAAIRDFLSQNSSLPGFSITWEPETVMVSEDADLGYMIEHSRMTFTDPSGARVVQFAKAVTVWRKDSTGAWKCAVDTWNENPTERALP